ncbi:peptidylprolyl isomerase [Polaribacter cellanae]|uniref:peptidylprolyl isomerase n=1 Tax=Polaribacter cellanae TaxID=2818493 RepID=A0A975CRY4_9FLAO|nr:peptidylprolyl isomerase [Polaribacter cellanae]QTE23675.1 peptidylprolyl isomerase [Polaribacter cellanae]
MKKYLSIFSLFVLIISCSTKEKYKNLKEGVYAEIQTNKGDILLELYSKDVPMTVANFVSLADGSNTKVTDSFAGKPYYNGIRFHRVVPNFIIQVGDHTETSTGNPGYVFGDEFPKDSVGNLLYKHNDGGIVSMANGGPDGNGSQIFITHRPIPHLDGKHTVFGKTIVNSTQLKKIKKKFSDSLALSKAIDSARMAVINKIAQFDTIRNIKIIKIGAEAENFNASKVFNQEFAKFEKAKKEKLVEQSKLDEKRYAVYLEKKKAFLAKMNEDKATKTNSGLRILKLKSTKGTKVVENKKVTVDYTIYVADGQKIQSTFDKGGQNLVFQLNDKAKPMITGFKEGVLTLREGEKARFFIPYYLAFGEQKYGPFPAKADVVFEVEVLKVGK